MCVCEALSTAMTAELPAVWNPTVEAAASVGLSDRVTSVEENDLLKGSGVTTAAETLINVSLTENSAADKDIGLSKTIIKADEGICRLLKVDSKSGETLRINSSSEESMPIKTETQNGTKLPKFVKKSSSPLLNINSGNSSSDEEEYFKPLKKLRMIPLSQKGGASPIKVDQESHQPQPLSVSSSSRVKSFSITDILRHSTSAAVGTGTSPHPKDKQFVNSSRIVRPWDTDEEQTEDYEDEMSISSPSSSTGGSPRPASSGPRLGESHSKHHEGNPLDALFQMTSKTFEGLKKGTNADGSGDRLLFSAKQSSKKKRKSRTAFSNHQIFELEKRFLYQKYLSPADRDELALTLGLTNAQVITWFQNRRAKLKRDLEEIKKDVHTTALLTDHSAFIKTMTQMGLKPVDLFNCRK